MVKTCDACGKNNAGVKLRKCSVCKNARYCGADCQKLDWPVHKTRCAAPSAAEASAAPSQASSRAWLDQHRKGLDNSVHFGQLELITWNGVDDDGTKLGFGGVVEEEGDDLRQEFLGKYKGDEAAFFKYRSCAFRWTCCGLDAGTGENGCDHHGDMRAPMGCKCDFCIAGRPLSDSIWANKLKNQSAKGLRATLVRGPDPRSAGSPSGHLNWTIRQMLGFGGEDE